jgi:hypothetical protein
MGISGGRQRRPSVSIDVSPKKESAMSETQSAPAAEPNYYEVALKSCVEVEGHLYRPGVKHIVDDATLAALGDAVVTKRPVA